MQSVREGVKLFRIPLVCFPAGLAAGSSREREVLHRIPKKQFLASQGKPCHWGGGAGEGQALIVPYATCIKPTEQMGDFLGPLCVTKCV